MCPVTHTLRTRGRALALTAVLAVSTAGCSVFSPFQTANTKPIADGVPVEGLPEGVQADNIALVSGLDGGKAVVTGAVENSGSSPVKVTIAVGDSTASTTVQPTSLARLGDKDLSVSGLEEGAGAMVDVEFTAKGKTIPLLVPVVDPTGYYAEYAPEGWTPAPSPSSSADESEEH